MLFARPLWQCLAPQRNWSDIPPFHAARPESEDFFALALRELAKLSRRERQRSPQIGGAQTGALGGGTWYGALLNQGPRFFNLVTLTLRAAIGKVQCEGSQVMPNRYPVS